MKTELSRRSFVKRSALGAGILASAPFNILHAQNKGEKIRFVQIGCGGRGMEHINRAIKEQFTALVEVNEKRLPAVQKWATDKGVDGSKLQFFTDYRKMFDKIGKDIDAIFIATPNHQESGALRGWLPETLRIYLGGDYWQSHGDAQLDRSGEWRGRTPAAGATSAGRIALGGMDRPCALSGLSFGSSSALVARLV
jgi:hypothetical protein